MLLSDLPESALITLAVVLGLLFGSFLNVVIHRLPRGQNIAFPPSTCPSCGARIAPYDNIPVIGWSLLRGKARCCNTSISIRYPAVEVLGGLLAAATMKQLIVPMPGSTPALVALGFFALYLCLGLGLLAALFIDFEHMILPDEITLGGAALGLVTLPFRPIPWADALIGGALGYLLVWGVLHHGYRLIRGQPGMGLGDAKLLLLGGIWFGWQGALFALMAGSIQGTLAAIAVYLTQGHLEEPAAVIEERAELLAELERLPKDERERLEAEFKDDILGSPPAPGLMQARLAFGPFLIIALLEFLLYNDWLTEMAWHYLWQV